MLSQLAHRFLKPRHQTISSAAEASTCSEEARSSVRYENKRIPSLPEPFEPGVSSQ